MAVSGLPEPCEEHVRCIARLALDMMDLSHTVVVDGVPVVSTWIVSLDRAECTFNDMMYTARQFINIHNIGPRGKRFFYNLKSIFLAPDNRHTQRRGGNGSNRSSNAPVLFIWQHRKFNQQDRNHGNTGKNQRLRKRIQVSTYT